MKATKAHVLRIVTPILHNWRNHVSERQMTLIIAFLIGFFASVAAFVLHSIIKEIQWLLTSKFTFDSYNWLYLLFPVIGIFFTMLFVRYVVKDNISHGITRILYAISTKRSRLTAHNCWSSVLGYDGHRCGRRYCRNIQGSNCRSCLHFGSTYGRFKHGLATTHTHLMSHRHMLHIHIRRQRLAFHIPPR